MLAQEYLVETQFGRSLEKFMEWGKGGQRLLVVINELTTLLDRVRSRGMAIMLLCHSKIVNEKNPLGADYGRWAPVLHRDTQAHLERWADAILFGQFAVNVATEGRKGPGKVRGDQIRLIQCEDHAGYVAGNRLGLPSEIPCGDAAATAWGNFIKALKGK